MMVRLCSWRISKISALNDSEVSHDEGFSPIILFKPTGEKLDMAGVVEKMLQSKEVEKERARGKYAKDKAKRRPGEPVKQKPDRDVLTVTKSKKPDEEDDQGMADDEECGVLEYHEVQVLEDDEDADKIQKR